MAVFLKNLEFFDKSGEIMVYKLPDEDGVMLETGSQLIVQENQTAIFYKDGKALDKFNAGRYTLSSANLPLLGGILTIPFKGKTPFSAYVYFISQKTFYNMGWGTPNPIPFKDSFFRLINLRANGAFSIRINEPELFLNTMVGTKGMETTYQVELYLKKLLVEKLTQSIGSKMSTVLEINTKYTEIADLAKDLAKESFGQYGIELVDLIVESITPPEEVQARINEASGAQAFDAEQYRSVGVIDAMKEAAKNKGDVSGMMGMAMGVGAGIGMGKVISNQVEGTTNAASAAESKLLCPKCGNPIEEAFALCPICKTKLKKTCKNSQCGKSIKSEWDVCPYCGTDQ
jgi:membrane protease subunit (stomatin/prohibitin family)